MQLQNTTLINHRTCSACERTLPRIYFFGADDEKCARCTVGAAYRKRSIEGTPVNGTCLECGEPFVQQYRVGQLQKFCSKKCRERNHHARPHNKRSGADSSIRRAYGITLEEAKTLYDAQGGKCALCLQAIPWDGRGRAIDHDHETGRVRGILCRGCNQALAYVERLPVSKRAWMDRAVSYLKERS